MLCTLLLLRSDSSQPIALCILGIGAGLFLFYQGFRLLQRRQLILNTPASRIRSASMGMVELAGLAAGPFTMLAPVSGRPCYYFRTLVWEWKRQGKNNQWVQVAAECMHVPFFLDDFTGKVLGDPRGAELDLHRDFQQEYCDSFFTTKEEVPANIRSLLLRHSISTTNKIKVEEFCIKPKNSLFLLGTLGQNPGIELAPRPIQDDQHNTLTFGTTFTFSSAESVIAPGILSFAAANAPTAHRSVGDLLMSTRSTDPYQPDPSRSGQSAFDRSSFDPSSFDQSALEKSGLDKTLLANSVLGKLMLEDESRQSASPQIVHLSPPAAPSEISEMTQQQKIAAALMKAGISNPAAWDAAGVSPATSSGNSNGIPVVNQTLPLDGFDPRPPVVMMKGKNNPTFLISWRSQRELARSLGWKCTLMIWGGPALTLISLWGLLTLTRLI